MELSAAIDGFPRWGDTVALRMSPTVTALLHDAESKTPSDAHSRYSHTQNRALPMHKNKLALHYFQMKRTSCAPDMTIPADKQIEAEIQKHPFLSAGADFPSDRFMSTGLMFLKTGQCTDACRSSSFYF